MVPDDTYIKAGWLCCRTMDAARGLRPRPDKVSSNYGLPAQGYQIVGGRLIWGSRWLAISAAPGVLLQWMTQQANINCF